MYRLYYVGVLCIYRLYYVGIIIPTMVCGLGWGDWWGGWYYASLLRIVWVHHATFCVNSLAHLCVVL